MINVSDNSSKYMIVSRSLNITTTENTLTVYNVTSSDVGTYTCNSSNIIGSVTSSGILTVTSKYYWYVIIVLILSHDMNHTTIVVCNRTPGYKNPNYLLFFS